MKKTNSGNNSININRANNLDKINRALGMVLI